MEAALFVILAIPIVGLIWFIAGYNALVRLRNHCRESWSNIDTELKRRYDLIPNLVNTVKGYAAHEQDLFERAQKLAAPRLKATDRRRRKRRTRTC